MTTIHRLLIMSYFKFIIICVLVLGCKGEISDLRLCGDPTCSVPISRAKTLIRYASPEAHLLSFKPNVEATVYSKSAGSRPDLWGIEIDGKRGYAPKSFLREHTILVKKLDHSVSTNINTSPDNKIPEQPPDLKDQTKPVPGPALFMGVSAQVLDSTFVPTDALPSYEVVDGTTIFNNPPPAEHTHVPLSPSVATDTLHTLLSSAGDSSVTSIHSSISDASTARVDVSDLLRKGEDSEDSEEDEGTESGEENLDDEEEEDEEEEGEGSTSKGLYQYLSGLLTGEGSGSDVSENMESVNNVPEHEEIMNVNNLPVDKNIGNMNHLSVNNNILNVPTDPDSTIQEKEASKLDHLGTQNDEQLIGQPNVDSSINLSENQLNVSGIEPEKTLPLVDEKTVATDEIKEKETYTAEENIAFLERSNVPIESVQQESVSEETVMNINGGDTVGSSVLTSEVSDKVGEDLPLQTDSLADGLTLDGQQADAIVHAVPEKTAVPVSVEQIDLSVEQIDLPGEVPDETIQTVDQLLLNVPTSSDTVNTSLESASETGGDLGIPVASSANNEHADIKVQGYPWSHSDVPVVVATPEASADAAPSDGAPSDAVPSDAAPSDAAPSDAAPSDEVPSDVASSDVAPSDLNSSDFNPSNLNSSDLNPSHIISSDVASSDVFSQEVPSVTDIDMSASNVNNDKPINEYVGIVPGDITSEGERNSENHSDNLNDLYQKPEETNDIEFHQPVDDSNSNLSENMLFPDSESVNDTVDLVEPILVNNGDEKDTLPSLAETGENLAESTVDNPPAESIEDNPADVVATDGENVLGNDDEESGVMSYITSMFSGVTNLFSSSKVEDEEEKEALVPEDLAEVAEPQEVSDVTLGTFDHSSCDADGSGLEADCGAVVPRPIPDVPTETLVDADVPVEPWEPSQAAEEMSHDDSREITVYLVVTAATVLVFTLGHFFIERSRQDAALVAKINSLEKSLLVSAKECTLVRHELEATVDKHAEDVDEELNHSTLCLMEELDEKKRECVDLEDQIGTLRAELDAATDAGMELNRMLTEFLETQHSTGALMSSVEQMQHQLNSQQGTIDTMNDLLSDKNAENENLQAALNMASDRIESLERDLNKATVSLSELLVSKVKQDEAINKERTELQHQVTSLLDKRQTETDNMSTEIKLLESQVAQVKEALAARERELAVTQECVAQLSAGSDFDGGDRLKTIIDVGQARAELEAVRMQRDALADELLGEQGAKKSLEDHVNVIREEVATLRKTCRVAEEERTEAVMKLKVLSSYFEEKEMQLQKDLDIQEAISMQKTGDMSTTSELITSLQEQTKSYRSQNETLKKEILDQERELKDQIATLEKKAHENWVSARQAERKLEEMKHEAGQLRNLLTISEKPSMKSNPNSDQMAVNDRLSMDVNGELPTSPLHMGVGLGLIEMPLPYPPVMSPPTIAYPPPHLGVPFMPPPTYTYDRRPPPLGCMSSPPLLPPPPPTTRHYTRHYDHHSPDRLSPDNKTFRSRGVQPLQSAPTAGFRPFPRTSKGSNLSSGQSSESLEK